MTWESLVHHCAANAHQYTPCLEKSWTYWWCHWQMAATMTTWRLGRLCS